MRMNIEPGLLRIFRFFSGLEAAFFWLVVSNVASLGPVESVQNLFYTNLFEALILFGYLSWPWLQRTLKRAYLPIALVISTIIPITSNQFFLQLQWGRAPAALAVTMWQFIPMLFVPLVLVAWQYNFPAVVLYSLFTGFLDYTLTRSVASYLSVGSFPVLSVVIIRTVSFIVVGYIVVQLMNTQREQRRALMQANLKLSQHANTLEQLATSRERNRLARELHDTLAHTLSGLAVQLEALKIVLPPGSGEEHTLLDHALSTTRNGLTETRRALKALRPVPLDDLGLSLAVRNLVKTVVERASLDVQVDIEDALDDLPEDMEQGLYRIIQEALENIVRHAHAQHAWLSLHCRAGQLELTIRDDGEGFDGNGGQEGDRFGLKGMQERAGMLGGKLTIYSQPGQGTTIHLIVEALYGQSRHL